MEIEHCITIYKQMPTTTVHNSELCRSVGWIILRSIPFMELYAKSMEYGTAKGRPAHTQFALNWNTHRAMVVFSMYSCNRQLQFPIVWDGVCSDNGDSVAVNWCYCCCFAVSIFFMFILYFIIWKIANRNFTYTP